MSISCIVTLNIYTLEMWKLTLDKLHSSDSLHRKIVIVQDFENTTEKKDHYSNVSKKCTAIIKMEFEMRS